MPNYARKFFGYLVNDTKMRTKIIIFVGLSMVFFILIVSFFIFMKVEKLVNNETGDSMMQVLNQINNSIDHNVKNSEIALDLFYNGSNFKSLISTNYSTGKYNNSFIEVLKQEIFSFKCLNDNVIDIRIFLLNPIEKDDMSVFGMKPIEKEPWLESLIEESDSNKFYWTNAGDSTWNKFSYTPAVYCYKAVFNDINHRLIGVLRMDISLKSIFESINSVKFGKSGMVFVTNSNGDIIYYSKNRKLDMMNINSIAKEIALHHETKGSFTTNISGQKEFLVFSKNNKFGWNVIGTITQNEFMEQTDSMRNFVVLTSLGICILAVVNILFFSSFITNRIARLSNVMDSIGKGNLKVHVNVNGKDEVGQLANNFVLMVNRIEDLVKKTEEHYKRENILISEKHELELLKKEAELRTLQMQINPHFLYNTLEMIKGLLFSEDPKNNIINATQALSELFKYNLNSDYIVKIRDEIKHIENYLLIHNLRFDNYIQLKNNIDDKTLCLNIIRFTFEPLIENAVKHGLRANKGDGIISISSQVNSDELVISIADNGIGMNAEKLSQVTTALESITFPIKTGKNSGIGMRNVNDRIKKHFGKKFGLEITSDIGEGTTVFIHLPIINDSNIVESQGE